ncbi:MAG: guanylate kinase [Eubacteriales bacterium]
MGYIFYLMGKSSSGKDTIYKEIQSRCRALKSVNLYTTRPIREGEKDGVEYYFVNDEKCGELLESGKVIELRGYNTVYGVWKYFTVDDEQFELDHNSYLMIGTLESYKKMNMYFGEDVVVPIYINVEDGVRLRRALEREESQDIPKYTEMCRRFLADSEDFSEEKLLNANIKRKFENCVFESCVDEIILYINEKI